MREVNIRGHKFQVTENQNAFWDNVEKGLWEPETFEVLEYFCRQGKTFVDIGAWNGVTSIYAKALGCNTVSIEPDGNIHHDLTLNLVSNNCRPPYCLAISDENGVKHLGTQSNFGNSESSLINRPGTKSATPVQTMTLETFISLKSETETPINISDIALIKMDIEGGEVLVLKQAKDFLTKHKPNMYISLHPAWFPNEREDLQMIIDVIFPIYKVCRMIDGVITQYSRDRFLQAVERGEHSYILIGK
jgi:FkbM family methyltransferase